MSHPPTPPDAGTAVNSTRSSFTISEPLAHARNQSGELKSKETSNVAIITAQGEEDVPRKVEVVEVKEVVKNLPLPIPNRDPNMVTWDGPDDPSNPQNWSTKRKWIITMTCIIMTVNVYVSNHSGLELGTLFSFKSPEHLLHLLHHLPHTKSWLNSIRRKRYHI